MSLNFSIFELYPELVYGFTEKEHGSMKIFDAEKQKEVEAHRKNKKKYFSALGVGLEEIVGASLIGGDAVEGVSQKDRGKIIDNTDSLWTKDDNTFLAITVADCFPVYFYNPKDGTIALAHAGWRGVAKNIIKKTLDNINLDKKTRVNMVAGIGPGIGKCHFDVKEEVLEKFKAYPEFINRTGGKVFIDLLGIIKNQLKKEGILEKNIETGGGCTFCQKDQYFSWRRDKEKITQGLAYIGVKKQYDN